MSEKQIGFFIREEPYGFLSNFERTAFIAKGIFGTAIYDTNEHYYQSEKANCLEVREWIRLAPHARLAMVLGQALENNPLLKKYLRDDWGDVVKQNIMFTGLKAKFANPKLRKMLLATGDAILFENNPEDPYWGIGDGSGQNWLGKLLMRVRAEIREEKKP